MHQAIERVLFFLGRLRRDDASLNDVENELQRLSNVVLGIGALKNVITNRQRYFCLCLLLRCGLSGDLCLFLCGGWHCLWLLLRLLLLLLHDCGNCAGTAVPSLLNGSELFGVLSDVLEESFLELLYVLRHLRGFLLGHGVVLLCGLLNLGLPLRHLQVLLASELPIEDSSHDFLLLGLQCLIV